MNLVAYQDITNKHFLEEDLYQLPPLRVQYVNSIKDAERKKQSFYVFKLLLAVLRDYNLSFDVNNIKMAKNGRWYFESENGVCFSLSHSKNFVAVAVSDNPTSVDVEQCSEKILKLKKRFEPVDSNSNSLIDQLTLQWTLKECLIKEDRAKFSNSKCIFDALGNKYYLTYSFYNSEDYEIVKY